MENNCKNSDTTDTIDTGKIIRKERIKKGLSQKELGEILGVSQQMIARYEKNEKNPKTETILNIFYALGISNNTLRDYIKLCKIQAENLWENVKNPKCSGYVPKYRDTVTLLNALKTALSMSESIKVLPKTEECKQENKLKEYYNVLNSKGKEKAIEQLEMLTKIEEYTKEEE